MNQEKKYYAIYTGEGDGIVIHSTWNNIESAVNELLKSNPKAKKYGFDNEADAKKFAKHGFDEKAKALLLDNMRLNKKINRDITNLSENEAIAFVAQSNTKNKNQMGYGALIFTNQGAMMPKELCGIINNTRGDLEATKQAVNWAMANNKQKIEIYYTGDNLENEEYPQEVQVTFHKVTGNHITHFNEANYVARAGAQGIEKS